MKKVILIRRKQKELLAEFYSNFALAWFSFGLIAPFFNKIEDINKLVLSILLSVVAGIISLSGAFRIIKNIYET